MALKSRILGLVVVAGLLSACGSVNPGAAAVVNGERITMQTADEAARTFCQVNMAGQPEGSATDNTQMRLQALASLIISEVADQVAKEEGIKVTVDNELPAEFADFRGSLTAADRAAFDSIYEANMRMGAIATELGRAAAPDEKNPEALAQLGMKELQKALAEQDIEIDPRFGLSPELTQIADSGSLSVATVNFDAPAPDERSLALQCSN